MLQVFARTSPNVSVGAEKLWQIGPVPITNSQVLGAIGVLFMLTVLISLTVAIHRQSRSRFYHAGLWAFEIIKDNVYSIIGDDETAKRVFPLAATLLFFFIFNNILSLFPLVGAVFYHGKPLLRGIAADMNTTFALAIISMFTAQAFAIKKLGVFGNLKRYFSNPLKDPLQSLSGVLELVSEFSRGIALSLRIFGNVLGGEVLLSVIAYLTFYFAPIALPFFYVLELFFGLIQAYIFFMLTIVYISLGLTSEHGENHEADKPVSAGTGEGAEVNA